MTAERFTYLLTGYFNKTATDAELDELSIAIDRPEYTDLIQLTMDRQWSAFEQPEAPVFSRGQRDTMLQNIRSATGVRDDVTPLSPHARIRPLFRWSWAAACVLLLAGYAFWYQLHTTRENHLTKAGASPAKNMITQKGQQKIIRLSDGTLVSLNAMSTLSYPETFDGPQRIVSLRGEAYFQIAPNPDEPFIVQIAAHRIEVLATSFNVNAYADEPSAVTTLIQGKIRIDGNILSPGQQAATTSGHTVITSADTSAVLAWKNGSFSFNNADLPTVMRQLARWYDIDVEYEGAIPQASFKGDIGKDLSLGEALGILARTRIRYRLSGKKVTILSDH